MDPVGVGQIETGQMHDKLLARQSSHPGQGSGGGVSQVDREMVSHRSEGLKSSLGHLQFGVTSRRASQGIRGLDRDDVPLKR